MVDFHDQLGPKPLLGVVHLLPLPGSPAYGGDWPIVRRRAAEDAAAYAEGGADGLVIENFGDSPFFPGSVPAETVAHMAVIGAEIRDRTDLPLGVNVLRNDGLSALSIAHAIGAAFIRVNVLIGARVADQGLLVGIAHDLLRLRRRLDAASVLILADVDVKHAASLAPRPIEEEVEETLERGRADAVIVTGRSTGDPANGDDLRRAVEAAGSRPVLVGSGVTPANVMSWRGLCGGFLVGTYCKEGGAVEQPVDRARVARLRAALDDR
ncbi:MAG: BtpA/SgcQ family protein [Planctomycetes bacterium]|nr:BtpA/SgcQ family protein [Planctomycetota bacterium]